MLPRGSHLMSHQTTCMRVVTSHMVIGKTRTCQFPRGAPRPCVMYLCEQLGPARKHAVLVVFRRNGAEEYLLEHLRNAFLDGKGHASSTYGEPNRNGFHNKKKARFVTV
jgi:hypothetical protein